VDLEVDESLYERDEATGVAREWLCGVATALSCECDAACGCVVVVCAVQFKAPHTSKPSTASSATGYLFNVLYKSSNRKWRGEIGLGVPVWTGCYVHPWQAAAALEWQLARWCEHTGQPLSHYVSNAAQLVALGHVDESGVLREAVVVEPWDLSPWKSAEEVAASEFDIVARS